MSSLREAKKQATRQAMSDAAARIVVDEGAEALTVARVAKAAGVSPRTFHNYFASLTEALLHFASDVITEVARQVPTYPEDASMAAIMGDITASMFAGDGEELRCVTSLFKVREALANMEVSFDDAYSFTERCEPMRQAFLERHPELSGFEINVMLNVCGTAGVVALQEISDRGITGAKEKRAIVMAAFDALTSLK